MKRNMTATILGLSLLALVGGIAGCAKEEGTAEQAGEKVDEAATQAQDAAKEAGDKLKDIAGD